MGAIEEAYEDIEAELSLEEFREAVEEKVDQMAGLADEETAALLVAHEVEENRVRSIDELDPDLDQAKFLAKVRRVGELRTFEREDDEDGYVINVEAADETGNVRLAFWDEYAKEIAETGLEPGTVLRVEGRPQSGMHGLEVSVNHAEQDEDAEIDVDVVGPRSIGDLTPGQGGVSLEARVLAVEPVRTFDRDDGTEGRVSNLIVGDESGHVRVTLWDERAPVTESIEPGEAVSITEGSVRERDGEIEIHVGNRGDVDPISSDVSFAPTTTPIASLEPGDAVDVAGVVRSTDPKRTFERDDGSEGQVRNVRIQDESGDVRVALWGEAADRDLAPGDTLWFGDVEVRDGWEDAVELSVGWQSTIAPIDLSAVTVADEPAEPAGGPSLAAFEDEDTAPDPTGESVTVTGTVVQTGTPIIVDDGEEAVHVETDAEVILGQEVEVVGERSGDRIDAESVRPVEAG